MEELKQELEEKFVEEANIKETGELFRFIEYNSDFIQWLITKISQVEPEVKVNFAEVLEEKKNELRILLAKLPKNDEDDETIRKKQMLTYGLLIIRDIEGKISA